nr:AAA family ATPase [Saliphagus infecundisoli]
MGREGSDHQTGGKDDESPSADPGTSDSISEQRDPPETAQMTFENGSESVDSPQEMLNDDSDGISIRERLQTESSGGVFANKDLVRSDTIIDEDRIVGRNDQLGRVVDNLKPVLQNEGLPDMLLSGPSGTGKSLIIHAVCKQIVELCESQGKTFGVLSINCEGPKTADRAVYRLVKAAANDLDVDPGVPQTGVSTDQKLERLYELMRAYYDGVIFILDEIDMLEGPYQEAEYNSLIYQLSRARKLADFGGPISLTTITNYADFMKNLNSRAQSSYNPDDIFFDDYDATQLRHILKYRRDAFKSGSLSEDVIPLVAAFGSQTHGDARKAIDLLRWAGELAERRGADTVTEDDVREAQEKYTENRKLRHISGTSTQKKLSIYAVAATAHYATDHPEWIPAGPAFKTYQFIAETMDVDQYSRETFVNHVTEQSTYGVLDFERRGKGRGRGVHMYFSLSEDPETIMETIREDSRFADLAHEDATITAVVRERLKNFRTDN